MILVQKAIIKKEDKYLILLRSKNSKKFAKCWDFPGGKLEPNETPFEGVEREVMEETQLKIKALKVLKIIKIENIKFTIYFSKIIEGEIKLSEEHTNYKWATKEEILKLKVSPYIIDYFS